MAAAATLQRKAQSEETDRTPEISAAAKSPVMPSRMAARPGRSALIQAQSFVSSADDAAEREADKVAAHVVSMPEPSAKASTRAPTSVMRSPLIVQRRAGPRQATPRRPGSAGSTNVMQQVKAAASGGFALSKKTRAYLEPRFKADFSNVRLHTDAKAKELSNKVGARAFTFGRHIFFNEGQYNPDSKAGLELLAHELTHTIQQREAIQRKPMVHERADPHVQRIFGALGDAVGGAIDAVGEFVGDVVQIVKDFVAEHADVLPGFKILCLVLGYNPVNDAPAPGGGRAILKELSTFIPFGDKVYEALNNHGIIDKGGAFIDTQIANFKALANAIIGAISSFLGSLGPSDALRPLGAWNRLKSSFTPVFASMKTFASGLISGFIDLVREVILKPMARWAAANIPHWDLLMGVLGINPVSNDGESPTMQLIGAFMKLIGQDEVWENIKKGNAIGRAWAWFQTAMSGAKAMVSGIPGEVMATIRSFTIMDVLTVVGAAGKILGLFASIGGKFISWAGGTVIELLKIVIDVVAPGVMVYIQRAAGAFQTIVRNPIGFVGNLVRAAMQGFRQFAANFLTHLQASLVGWLTGALGGTGVYIPRGMNLREILKFVLSVLGLTWANIRQKLVRATNETTVVALETGMDIVRTLVTEGPAAAWQKILETLTNLKQMAIDAIMDFVKQRVVQAAVTRLLSMLSPAGAFIQAVIAIYNTIMFFVERLRQIAQVAASFIDAIATIASGNIGPAANRVETTMAGLLTLVISFLARIAGLGRVADAITGLIARVRAPINTAIDRVVAWIVAQARRLGAAVMRGARGAAARVFNWWRARHSFRGADGASHSLYFSGEGAAAQPTVASTPMPVAAWLSTVRPRIPASNAAALNAHGAANSLLTGALRQSMAVLVSGSAVAGPTTAVSTQDLERNLTRLSALLAVLAPFDPGAASSANVPARIPPVRVNPGFTMGRNLQDAGTSTEFRDEYNRQLQMQQDGIIAMNVRDWLANRAGYVARRTATGSGRASASAAAQQAARTAARTLLAQRFAQPRQSPFTGLNSYELGRVERIFARNNVAATDPLPPALRNAAVNEIMDSTNALHSPDQIAGGSAAGLTGLGLDRINQSIGAQWPGRIASIQSEVLRLLSSGWGGSGPITTDADRARVQMDVVLVPVV
jgi:Domain of unknown function (DUF4157)/Novel toxin 15